MRRCACLAAAWLVLCSAARAAGQPEATPAALVEAADADAPGGMFLPVADGQALWRQTLATVAAEWPIVRADAPDFSTPAGRPGVIESAWVEPPGGPLTGATPQRQRVIVRVVPSPGGAWIDAALQTQSLATAPAGNAEIGLVSAWETEPDKGNMTVQFAAQLAPGADVVTTLPPVDSREMFAPPQAKLPWADSQFPRVSRAGYKVLDDYRNFYSCEPLVCLTGAFGAGALMANTGFDVTMQDAWQSGVAPTSLGTFFSDCKFLGEGMYLLPVASAAAVTGMAFEGAPVGDFIGEWGSRSLRMFVVGAPPLYVLQWATGASRPDESPAGSKWKAFQDSNGVSGHAFIGAVPFLAAADMVESPLLKGTLYVCSTFTGFSRMTDNAHFPSQVFLGWYLAWASARAVNATEMHFADMEVRVVPLPMADLGGMAIEARW
ncbi:MAG: phosphatase PAP2 family protein [Pirellulales bacterium]